MRQFLAKNVGWVRCACCRAIKLPLDYERTVTQQSSDSYLSITVLVIVLMYESRAGRLLIAERLESVYKEGGTGKANSGNGRRGLLVHGVDVRHLAKIKLPALLVYGSVFCVAPRVT